MEKILAAYNILGVSSDSSLGEVTKAYRKLAKKYHPDSNPENLTQSHEMMMKINEAYKTIKENVDYTSTRQKTNKDTDTIWWWMETYRRKREAEIERLRREREKQEREIQKFWERVTIERRYEIVDKKVYDLIVKYAYKLVSYFYVKNFHNALVIRRPYFEREFEEFVSKFIKYMKKIRKLCASCNSKQYKSKTIRIYQFLKSFILDTAKTIPAGVERRASALDIFQKAVRNVHSFIIDFFSIPHIHREEAERNLKELLREFEVFIKSYPDSPLIQYAHLKIDILEKLYMAFLKGF